MTIKLDRDIRIRLDDEDIENWKSVRYLVRAFSFGDFVFQVSICFDATAPASYFHSECQKLTVGLTSSDCESLFSSEGDGDIEVGNIKLQVDRWSKNRRSHYEGKKSRFKNI